MKTQSFEKRHPLKTQNFGLASLPEPPLYMFTSLGTGGTRELFGNNSLMGAVFTVKHILNVIDDYRHKRENGEMVDSPDITNVGLFGWYNLAKNSKQIVDSTQKGYPDREGRNWWMIKSIDNEKIRDYYWVKEKSKGWPDIDGRYWFSIHGPRMQAETFCIQRPSKSYKHWCILYFESDSVKCWMEKKDKNYLARLKRESEPLPTQNQLQASSSSSSNAWSQHKKVKVIYNFDANQEGDLTIIAGETLTLLEQLGNSWCHCQNSQGQQGMVPMNYLSQLTPQNPYSPPSSPYGLSSNYYSSDSSQGDKPKSSDTNEGKGSAVSLNAQQEVSQVDIAGAQIALLTVCAKIDEHAQLVKCNKRQCLRLAERTRVVVDLLQGLVAQLSVAERGAPPARQALPPSPGSAHAHTRALASLKQTLDDALLLVQSFVQKIQMGVRAYSHRDKFDEIYARLEQDIQQLNLGLDLYQVLSGQEQKAQDAQDKEVDHNDLLTKQDEILHFNQEAQKSHQQWVTDEANRYKDFQMKTQHFGTEHIGLSPGARYLAINGRLWPGARDALNNYRENRENGTDQDNPKTTFPSAGFDALDIKESNWKSSNDWPDKQGRHWWEFTLNDGRVIEDFYWTKDEVRGYPDKSNKDRDWFIVHHKNGTKIEGFSQEQDYEKGFPDKDNKYWYTIRFTDTHCSAIRQWMEEKDKNYLARLKEEEKSKNQPVLQITQQEPEHVEISHMKTQNFGQFPFIATTMTYPCYYEFEFYPFSYMKSDVFIYFVLKNYRKNRENGAAEDAPKNPFPSAGFDALAIKLSDWKSSNDWPDKQGRYWWKLTLNDGRIVEDFYWTKDEVRGFPEEINDQRYWFIVHHKNGTKIEGFSFEPNHEKGFPEVLGNSNNYWYTVQFTDTHCPAIRQWMEGKDKNYLARLKREGKPFPMESQPQAPSSSKLSSQHVDKMRKQEEERNRAEEAQKQREAEERGKREQEARRQDELMARKANPIKLVLTKDSQGLKEVSRYQDTNWLAIDEVGNTVFHVAAQGGNYELFAVLIQVVPKEKQKNLLRQLNQADESPLHVAARGGNINIVKDLLKGLERNAKISLQQMNNRGYMPLHEAARNSIDPELIDIILAAGADVNALTEDGETAFQIAEKNSGEFAELTDANYAEYVKMLSKLSTTPLSSQRLPNQMQALYDYAPQDSNQLALRCSEVITVLQENVNDWSYCQNSQGDQGYVPANYLTPWQGRSSSDDTPSPKLTPNRRYNTGSHEESEGSTPKQPSKTGSGGSRVGLDETGQGNVDLIIPNGDLTLGQELGKGTFGAVYQGDWHGTHVAIKKLLEQKLTQNLEENFLYEAGLMMQLQHENVVRLYGVSLKPYGMVLEFMAKGSLDRVLHSTEPLSWQLRYTISLDVAKGLAFLHRKLVLHRDLKSLNVLLDEQYKAKLADFGLSKIKTSSSQTYNAGMAGTLQWIAPELLNDAKERFTQACDVYSYGMLVWELLSREKPYRWMANPGLVYSYVGMQGRREDIPPNAPAILSTLTTQCWSQEANERPTMAQVVKTLQERPVTDKRPQPSPHAKAASPTQTPPNRIGQSGYQSSFDQRPGAMPAGGLPTPAGQYAQGGGYGPSQQFFQAPQPPLPPRNPQSGYGYQPPFPGGGYSPPQNNNYNPGGDAPSGYGNSGHGKR